MKLFYYAGSSATRQELSVVTEKIAQRDAALNHSLTACFFHYIAPLLAWLSCGCVLEARQRVLQDRLVAEGKRNITIVACMMVGMGAAYARGLLVERSPPYLVDADIETEHDYFDIFRFCWKGIHSSFDNPFLLQVILPLVNDVCGPYRPYVSPEVSLNQTTVVAYAEALKVLWRKVEPMLTESSYSTIHQVLAAAMTGLNFYLPHNAQESELACQALQQVAPQRVTVCA